MLVQDIAKLSKWLVQFLARFACFFARPAGRTLLQIYTRGLLSDVRRKNAEAIALRLYREEAACQRYHARRNAQASESHRTTRRKRLAELGIDPDKIKSVPPRHAN